MQVPLIGAGLIWLGAITFVIRPRHLLHLAVFFMPFSQTAVLVAEGQQSLIPLPAWMFFAALACVKEIAGAQDDEPANGTRSALRALAMFGAICTLSVGVPLLLSNYAVPSPSLLERGQLRLVAINLNSVLVLFPLLLGIGVVWLVARRCTTEEKLKVVIRAAVLGTAVVAAIGLWEYMHYQAGFPYPQSFLRSAEAARVAPVVFGTGLRRLASVASESSILARTLLLPVPILMVSIWHHRPIMGRLKDRLALLLIGLVLALSISSTALVGSAGALVSSFLIIVLVNNQRLRPKVIATVTVVLAGVAAAALYHNSVVVQETLAEFIFNKSYSDSYSERTLATDNAWTVFHDFPLLGVGLNNAASYDLVGKLLSNVGLVGAVAFFWSMVTILRKLYGLTRRDAFPAVLAQGLLPAVALQLLLASLGGFEFDGAYFWLGVALAVGLLRAAHYRGGLSAETAKSFSTAAR